MNKITDKILADASSMVENIKKDYEEKLQSARAAYEKTQQNILCGQNEKLDDLYQKEMNRFLALATMEERKKILAIKWALIHELFADLASEVIENVILYTAFLGAMAIKGSISGSEQIIVSKKDQQFITFDFLKKVNEKLYTEKGIDGMLSLSEDTRDIKGLILEKDKINFNGTITSAMEIIQRDFLPEIVKILFQAVDAPRR
jgi:vacuolar-type H+-ATPase subunit E/Vma4